MTDTSVLSSAERIRAADPEGMLARIKELDKQVRDGWRIGSQAALAPQFSDVRNVVVAGMGGSAIGADLAAALLLGELKVPMTVHRDYGLPAYAGRDTLLIASSYSGGTEETISAIDEGRKRGAKIVAITTGGAIAELGRKHSFPVVKFSYKARPRAVLGYSLSLMLGVLHRLGFVRDLSGDIETGLAEVSKLEERVHEGAPRNEAKDLAAALSNTVPFVYGAGPMAVMARRVKGQLNENSKNWAAFDAMPELNHNAVVGFPHPDAAKPTLRVLILASEHDNPRVRVRWDVTRELLDRAGVTHHTLRFPGASALSEVLQMAYFTDHVSFYLALLNGADPSPNTSIDQLKERLAKS